jgi:hypothetical protein
MVDGASACLCAMSNQGTLRRKLRAVVSKHAVTAAETAVSGGDASEDIRRLEELQKLLAALPYPILSDMYPAITIAFICLLAASIAWIIRVPTTKVHLAVKTTAVSMHLAAPLAWQGTWPVGRPMVRLEDVTKLEIPPEFGGTQQLTGRAWLNMLGGNIALTALDISRGAQVSVIRTDSGVDILTLNKPFQGQLVVGGNPTISASRSPGIGIKPAHQLNPPVTVSFYDAGRPAIPARLRVSPSKSLKLQPVPIDALSLFRETTDFEQRTSFASAISGGSITLSDTGAMLDLKAGEVLHLGSRLRA